MEKAAICAGIILTRAPLKAAVLASAFSLFSAGDVHLTPGGAALAAASGAVASAIGYVLWYTIVPVLGAPRAAALQLAVPAIIPLAATGLLGEPITARLLVSGTAILAGVGIAIAPRGRLATSRPSADRDAGNERRAPR